MFHLKPIIVIVAIQLSIGCNLNIAQSNENINLFKTEAALKILGIRRFLHYWGRCRTN